MEKNRNNMFKLVLLATGIFAVLFALNFISAVDDGVIIVDSLNRTIFIDYIDNNIDTSYSYYGNSLNISKINIGYGQSVYYYDTKGNLLKEEYSLKPENNVEYTYYPDGNLESIKKDNSEILYYYDLKNRVTNEDSFIDGKVFPVKYEYDSQDRLTQIIALDREIHYYYDPVTGNLISESITKDINGEKVTDVVNYEYDSSSGINKISDSEDFASNYEYEKVDYNCQEIQCLNYDCSDPDATCYTFYDCTSGSCLPYTCSDYTLADTTCSYDRVKAQKLNNYVLDSDYDPLDGGIDYCSNFDSECYPLIENYDANGSLIQDDYYIYSYDENGTLISRKDSDPVFSNNSVNYEYNDDGTLFKEIYDDGNFTFDYNPLGEALKQEYYFINEPLNNFWNFALILSNLMTGKAIDYPNDNKIIYYMAYPGDRSSIVDEAEYNRLVSEYEAIYGPLPVLPSSKTADVCIDNDLNNSSDSAFISSYVLFNGNFVYDTCSNNQTLQEAYCGREFRLDFWNMQLVPKYSTIDCELGCIGGACLRPIDIPTNETIPPINESELPPIPIEPERW
jgi:hypothetical protein